MDPKGTQMEPKGAEMKPHGLPKVPKSLPTIPHVCQNGSPRFHNGAPRPPKVPKRDYKALQSATKTPKEVLLSLGKTQGAKKHVQTARGRVLAEGGVDPAAGSRDEPTRLHVESPVAERKQGIEVQVTRALFLKSFNWVPPLSRTP